MEKDEEKLQNLEKLGYKVITIWQSDNLSKKQKELQRILNIKQVKKIRRLKRKTLK